MVRTVLTATLFLLPLGLVFGTAAKAIAADKKAQIKALEEQKKQLHHQMHAHMKQIDEATRKQIEQLRLQEGEMKTTLNAKLVHEDKLHEQRIEARFDNIIRHLKPGAKEQQMIEEAHQTLQGINQVLKGDNPDYGGHRAAAIGSLGNADHHVKLVLEHNTHEDRVKASKHMGTAVGDLGQALQYSWQKYGIYGYSKGVPQNMPKSQQASDAQLAKAIPNIEAAQWLLSNAGPDRGQFEAKRRELHQKKEAEKHATHAEYVAKIRNVDKEIAGQLQQTTKTLQAQAEQKKQQIKAQITGTITGIDQTINQLKKSK
jgi:hypothetical protein